MFMGNVTKRCLELTNMKAKYNVLDLISTLRKRWNADNR